MEHSSFNYNSPTEFKKRIYNKINAEKYRSFNNQL